MYTKQWALFILGILFMLFVVTFNTLPDQSGNHTNHYVVHGLSETGATNLVTGILLDYRGFDTLGEAVVIFAAAGIIGFFAPKKKIPMLGVELNVLVRYGVALILPFLLIFGFYIILFGHLSPGGGFTGGVVLASTVIIFDLVFGFGQERVYLFRPETKKQLERFGLAMFILIGVLGMLTSGSFLANHKGLISLGKVGSFFSGGWIVLLNVACGLKVGSGLAIIFHNLVKGN